MTARIFLCLPFSIARLHSVSLDVVKAVFSLRDSTVMILCQPTKLAFFRYNIRWRELASCS